MKSVKKLVLAVAVAVLGVGQAKADLIGSTVDVAVYYPDRNTLYADYGTKTVSPTAVFAMNNGESSTITGAQITFTGPPSSGGFGSGSFNGVVYDFLNSGDLITGVTLDGATTLSGFTQSGITLRSDGAGGQLIELNVQGLAYNPSDNVAVDIATRSSAVPEPSSLFLLGLGGIGLAIGSFRRRMAGIRSIESTICC